jgi:hypothetical protein
MCEKDERIDWWKKIVLEYQDSKLGMVEYAKEKGLNYRSIVYWISKLGMKRSEQAHSFRVTEKTMQIRQSGGIRNDEVRLLPVRVIESGKESLLDKEIRLEKLPVEQTPGAIQTAMAPVSDSSANRVVLRNRAIIAELPLDTPPELAACIISAMSGRCGTC